jgi:hypothetical protein
MAKMSAIQQQHLQQQELLLAADRQQEWSRMRAVKAAAALLTLKAQRTAATLAGT